jgi:transketolase
LPALRDDANLENKSARGGYILRGDPQTRQITLMATGSEVSLAVNAAETLAAQGIQTCVISMPCLEIFDQQDAEYRKTILGSAPRIAIEAAISMSWARYLRADKDAFIGMSSFGESAPAPLLYKHFGITVDAVVSKAISLVKK